MYLNVVYPKQYREVIYMQHRPEKQFNLLEKTQLRTFARKSSNIDFFIRLLPQLGFELLLSEMQKNWRVTDFVSAIRYLKGHPNFEKSVFLT